MPEKSGAIQSSVPRADIDSKKLIIVPNSSEVTQLLPLDTESRSTEQAWEQFLIKKEKENFFLKVKTKRSLIDSNKLAFSLDNLEKPILFDDEIADQIQTRNQGVKPSIPIQNIFSKILQNKKYI